MSQDNEPEGRWRDELNTSATCAHCKGRGGSFWRATYTGAPEGGVPVHVKCAREFFAAIDASPFWKAP